nr:agouti-signaling protein isoform X1 [Monopterus albus]XP_020480800.1 agouti-signaling protein isoform X1 [Monopterus albus]XP_020480801.1 agouti-signaling protein isoform X1 [Monopterus albus]
MADSAPTSCSVVRNKKGEELQQRKNMQAFLLLGCCVLAAQCCLGSAHMVPDERLSTNREVVSNALSRSLDTDSPPVVIEELSDSVKNKKLKKSKKNKLGVKTRRRPPANCIPLGGSCKSPGKVCCDFCAFCQCRLFRTVCFCRMGNPRC